MDDGVLLNQLEELAEQLGIRIRYGNMPGEDPHHRSGLCRVKGQYQLFICSRSTVQEKIGVFVKTFKGFEMGDAAVPPAIRDLLDKPDGRIGAKGHEEV